MSASALAYAAYVSLVSGLIAFDPPPEEPASTGNSSLWLYSVSHNGLKKSPDSQDGFVSIESRPQTEILWRFKPLFGLGLSTDGAAYVTAAVRKDFKLGPVQLTPYIGPVLYQSDLGHFRRKELLQFRTGLDVLVPITPRLSVGLGFFHMSNAVGSKSSADLDVTRLSIQYKF